MAGHLGSASVFWWYERAVVTKLLARITLTWPCDYRLGERSDVRKHRNPHSRAAHHHDGRSVRVLW